MGYEAFVLTEAARQTLRERFAPKHPLWIGHHVTHKFGVPKRSIDAYGQNAAITLVGYAYDEGLETFVVTVDGLTTRPDDKPYHLTWSLDPAKGKKPVDSNTVIARANREGTYQPVEPITVQAVFRYVD